MVRRSFSGVTSAKARRGGPGREPGGSARTGEGVPDCKTIGRRYMLGRDEGMGFAVSPPRLPVCDRSRPSHNAPNQPAKISAGRKFFLGGLMALAPRAARNSGAADGEDTSLPAPQDHGGCSSPGATATRRHSNGCCTHERELHRIARHYMRRESRGTRSTDDGARHEAYFRLIEQKRVRWQNRAHFFAIAAKIMRRILPPTTRATGTATSAAAGRAVSLFGVAVMGEERSAPSYARARRGARAAGGVRPAQGARRSSLRHFGGLTPPRRPRCWAFVVTVERDWSAAKAWLAKEVRGEG